MKPVDPEELRIRDAPGWPRPWRRWKARLDLPEGVPTERLLPVPWINGGKTLTEDWLAFRADAIEAHDNRLCTVCGETMEGTIVLGRYGTEGKFTSGPGGHPRCLLLAVSLCPHFAIQDNVVAYAYDGPTPGYRISSYVREDAEQPYVDIAAVKHNARPLTREALRELAKRSPLGV